MKLMLVRHAIALELEELPDPRAGDAARPLSRDGAEKMALQVAGLRRIVDRLDLIWHSPYLRTTQTAALIQQGFSSACLESVDALAPGGSGAEILRRLAQLPANRQVALVGHEPEMSIHVSLLTAAAEMPFVRMKKGGAAWIEFSGPPAYGQGQLLWYLPPRVLRALAGAAAQD